MSVVGKGCPPCPGRPYGPLSPPRAKGECPFLTTCISCLRICYDAGLWEPPPACLGGASWTVRSSSPPALGQRLRYVMVVLQVGDQALADVAGGAGAPRRHLSCRRFLPAQHSGR